MGILSVFRHKDEAEAAPTETTPAECVHGVRVPHWDSVADMGHEDRASYFVCESCGQQFSPEESAAIHAASVVEQVEQ